MGIVHGISEHDAYSRARIGLDVFGRWRCFRLYPHTLGTGLDLKTKHQGSRGRGGIGLPQENGGRSSGHEGIVPSGISSLPLFNKFPSSRVHILSLPGRLFIILYSLQARLFFSSLSEVTPRHPALPPPRKCKCVTGRARLCLCNRTCEVARYHSAMLDHSLLERSTIDSARAREEKKLN